MQHVEKICVDMPLPEEVYALKQAFTDYGAKLYVVGGSVRDFWYSIEQGKPFVPKDFDLVTDLHPDKVVELLKRAIHDKKLRGDTRVREVGKSFGVILVTVNGKDFEIATFREDAKSGDGRRPDYVVFSTIDKDAERRDLTINALYYDLEEKCILDFFGGVKDIHDNRVRFVGDARERIHEDKLRIMRFARFYCRVNNDKSNLQKDTREVIRQTALRPEISDERIRDEFLKGLASAISVRSYLGVLEDLGLLEQLFLGMHVVLKVHEDRSPESVMAQLLRFNDPDEVKETLLKLKYTAQESTDVSFLLRISKWQREEQFVDFKKAQRRFSLNREVIDRHVALFGDPIVLEMLEAPYPTVNGDVVMQETGLEGKALGEEMLRRELENFKTWRGQVP